MINTIPIKLQNTYKNAYFKYGWQNGVEGLCVDFSLVQVAMMAKKDLDFVVKRRKAIYRINPSKAYRVANKWQSYFTRRKDHKLVIVVPRSECERIII